MSEDQNKEMSEEQQKKLEEAKVYMGMVKSGQLFISYIMNDLKRTKNKEMDRARRKRMSKELRKGVLCEELVTYYEKKVDGILAWIQSKKQEAKSNG